MSWTDDEHLVAAIGHAADAGGARIAARKDTRRAAMWTAIAEDQSRLAQERLAQMRDGRPA